MFDICLQHQLLLKLPEKQTWFTKALFLLEGFLQCLGFFNLSLFEIIHRCVFLVLKLELEASAVGAVLAIRVSMTYRSITSNLPT